MGRVSDTLAAAFVISVVTEIMYQAWVYLKKKKARPCDLVTLDVKNEVLFFPDRGIACPNALHEDTDSCGVPNCGFYHDETSLKKLVTALDSTQRKLDVCVYIITCDTLGDAILSCHKRGRTVRVITEAEGSDTPGSQIGKLRAAGIGVRTNNKSTFLMHHKFAVVDEQLLVSGSFNWTRQAIAGNHENLLLTREPDLVGPYVAEFERLWDRFRSEPLTASAPDQEERTAVLW